MQSPDERSRTTFGKRRTGEAAPGAQAGPRTGSTATAALAPMAEPETTGAIAAARSARTTRLDPCVAPAGDRLRP
ncbi:hypothetical protein [Methylobacterium oryzae]|uniref:hypothetical protein n=1 Tax=Methylobacterium oryzae TaxID=334852 RepID=UPI002F2CB153